MGIDLLLHQLFWKKSAKEEQTATVLMDMTPLCVLLHYEYNIYSIETKDSKVEAHPHPPLPPAEDGWKRKRYHVV